MSASKVSCVHQILFTVSLTTIPIFILPALEFTIRSRVETRIGERSLQQLIRWMICLVVASSSCYFDIWYFVYRAQRPGSIQFADWFSLEAAGGKCTVKRVYAILFLSRRQELVLSTYDTKLVTWLVQKVTLIDVPETVSTVQE